MVSGVLEDTGLAPHLLELEITEKSLMEDDNSDHQKIKDLQKMGVKIAMEARRGAEAQRISIL